MLRVFGQPTVPPDGGVRPPPVPPLMPLGRVPGLGFTPARETQTAIENLAGDAKR